MKITIQDAVDIGYLDDVLLEPTCKDGHPCRLPKPVPFSAVKDVPTHHILQWCVARAVYQVVTDELLNWLAARIKGKKAIEVCAGYGTIGRHLGIPMSDSYMQIRPEIKKYYQSLKQAYIHPPADVLKMEANFHVVKDRPEVVIGSWVTQLHIPGERQGSVFGVDEWEILNLGAQYIHVGNDETHGYKRLMKIPHEHHHFPWLISRSTNQTVNHLAVWERPL